MFSPQGILRPPVLRQVKTANTSIELNVKFSAKYYLFVKLPPILKYYL